MREDLGPVDTATPISVAVWLRPHDQRAFDLAVAARSTPASALYHQWMTKQEIASFSTTQDDITSVVQALRQAGLQVDRPADDTAMLWASGNASAIQAAFGTPIHRFLQAGRESYANIAEPHLQHVSNALVAGITGLSNAPMTPFVLRPTDPRTGKPMAGTPWTGVLNPYTVFTDTCFKAAAKISLDHPGPTGDVAHARYAGPEYTTRDLPGAPFKTCGYRPNQLATHYGLDAVYAKGYLGQGQTIVIVDAYGSPTILSDANTFAKIMHLPELTAANFQVVYPDGPPKGSPFKTNWPEEVSLDVEWAHALAPLAKIVLVAAPDATTSELAYAIHYAAVHQLGDVISNSYGSPEAGTDSSVATSFNAVIERAAAQGIAVNVSTGDAGDLGLGTPVGAASIPADSPFATSVGGTSLNVPSDNGQVDAAWGSTFSVLGNYARVAVPPDVVGFVGGSGGGESVDFGKPLWQAQAGLPGKGRQLPDISAVADPLTGGVIVADNGSGKAAVLLTIGGTSLSSPVFSAVWALAQQAAGERLGQAAPIIAAMPSGAVTDILPVQATKSNLSGTIRVAGVTTAYSPAEMVGLAETQPTGFVGIAGTFGLGQVDDLAFGADSSLTAAPGWDTATGFGEPNGLAFIEAAQAAASSAAGSTKP